MQLQTLALSLLFVLIGALAAPSAEAIKSFDERFAEAERFRIANDYVNALDRYTALAKTSPTNSRVHANLGWVLVQIGRLDEAKKEIDRAIVLNDRDPSAHQALAIYYMVKGDKKTARLEYIKRIALDPKHNCHCGGIQRYLGITASDEKKAKMEGERYRRMSKPVKRK